MKNIIFITIVFLIYYTAKAQPIPVFKPTENNKPTENKSTTPKTKSVSKPAPKKVTDGYVENFELDYGLTYTGYIKNGVPHGYGKRYFSGGTIEYEGDWVNGKCEGYGTKYYDNGKISYVGNLKEGDLYGYGKCYYYSGKLWYDGVLQGSNFNGKWFAENSDYLLQSFEGELNFGVANVYFRIGLAIFKNGDKFKGNFTIFKTDDVTNKGTYYFANGDRFEGYFLNQKPSGAGIYYWSNGVKFDGYFKDGDFESTYESTLSYTTWSYKVFLKDPVHIKFVLMILKQKSIKILKMISQFIPYKKP